MAAAAPQACRASLPNYDSIQRHPALPHAAMPIKPPISASAGGPAGKQDLPGTGGKRRAMIRTRAVALGPTGRSFAAATTEGLLVYTLDQGLVFDPTDLAQDVTPEAAHAALAKGQALRAALIALRLRDGGLLRHALLSTPPEQVGSGFLAACVPAQHFVEGASWGRLGNHFARQVGCPGQGATPVGSAHRAASLG